MKTIYTSLVFCILLSTCENENSDSIIGHWSNLEADNDTITLIRVDHLEGSEYGFSFEEGGIFTERKNAGWCGTPPITYANFDGTWLQTDSLVEITVGYWGGQVEYRWIILSVDKKKLTYYRENEVLIPDL